LGSVPGWVGGVAGRVGLGSVPGWTCGVVGWVGLVLLCQLGRDTFPDGYEFMQQ
jgi:hypothetical protein